MPFSHLLLAFLLVLIWGFNFVVIKLGLDGFPPIFLACLRFFFTSIPAIFFLKQPKVFFGRLMLYGLTMFAFQFAFFFIGMQLGILPGLAAILVQTNILFSLLIAFLFFKEKIRPWQIGGSLIAMTGISWIGLQLGITVSTIGFLFLIASAACWSIGSTISKTMGKVNMLALVVWGSMIAWPFLAILSLLIEGPSQIAGSIMHFSWVSVGAVFYLAYLSTHLGFSIWSWLLHHHPLSTIAPITLSVPIFAMIFSALIIGEPLPFWKIGAALLVIGGLGIHFLASRFAKR